MTMAEYTRLLAKISVLKDLDILYRRFGIENLEWKGIEK